MIFSSFFLVGFFHLTDQQLAGFVPEVVITGVELDLTVIDIGNLCADLIQEITVMGNNNNGVVKVDQEFFQPCDRIQIQVVGRLIQKKNIRITKSACARRTLTFCAPVSSLIIL